MSSAQAERGSSREVKRQGRTVELIVREAANFIKEAAGAKSLITATRGDSYARGDRVTVYVSVFPEEQEQGALAFLARQREQFSDYLKHHTRLAPLPRVDFALDLGEKNRRRLEELGGA